MRLARRGEQKFLPAADESRVEGVFGEGQIDDRLCGLDDGAPLPALDEGVVEYGELASVDLQRIPVPGEGEHQPLGTGAFHVPRLDTRRESAKSQGFPPLGFHLIGGRGSSMCATSHSCFVSLHSAKATGRPRST